MKSLALSVLLCVVSFTCAAESAAGFTRIVPTAKRQTGTVPAGAARPDQLVLAHEPESTAGLQFDFDLDAVAQGRTPLARLHLGEIEKVKVTRPGQTAGGERAALHVFVVDAKDAPAELAGSQPVKPAGIPTPYTIDITGAVNAALARPAGTRRLRLEVRITGKPLHYEVYALSAAEPALELAAPARWADDWEKRLAPITRGSNVYRESCMPFADERNREVVLPLIYPAKKILEVVHNGTSEQLREGRDWTLRDGQLVLPAGTRAPVSIEDEFFQVEQKDKEGNVKKVRSQIRVVGGPLYHQSQIEVTYEPAARELALTPARSSLDQLPRLKARLTAKAPVSVILFGDSISAGYDSSKLSGVWPFQPDYGELVVRRLEQRTGSKITYMNHARAGGTSAHALTQTDAQVAWFKPDVVLLAYGMNDRSPERRVDYRANLEKIIDVVRARSPETEFVIITPMLNNPKQPTGLDPVKFIRDEALAVARPGVAFVDVTTTQLELMQRKSYLDLSGNGVNHPNDFLMRIYAQRVLEVLAP